jgi:hypothetical protein
MKKNYLKLWLLLFVIGLFTNNIFAQGAYINFNTGYALKASSANLDMFDLGFEDFGMDEFNNTSYGENSGTFEQVNVSLGKGLNFGAAFGYMFNKNVGAELGLSFLKGGKSTATYEEPNYSEEFTIRANMLRIIPSIVIASGFETVDPYAKFGIVIGTASTVTIEGEMIDDDESGTLTIKAKGGLPIGFNAAVGTLFKFNENIALFAEINMINLSYSPKKGEITELMWEGENHLPDFTVSEKEWEFVDSYTYNFDNPPSDTQPREELTYKLPYGSIGLNFGLRISF